MGGWFWLLYWSRRNGEIVWQPARFGLNGAGSVTDIKPQQLTTSSLATATVTETWSGEGWPVPVSRVWTMIMSNLLVTWRCLRVEITGMTWICVDVLCSVLYFLSSSSLTVIIVNFDCISIYKCRVLFYREAFSLVLLW